jgi:alginate O-acetyltransferase complex protein AlgI
MCLGGLWHGASWTFVVWGAYHGVLLILHRVFRGRCERSKVLNWAMRTPPGTVARVAATFVFVCVGWVFFRAESFGAAQSILRNMFVPRSGLATPLPLIGFYCTVAVVALAHLLGRNNLWKKICLRLPTPALGFGYGALVALAMLLAPDSGKAFIYFQF